MTSTVAKGALAALVRALGLRRVLNLVRRPDPKLVGGHITSDWGGIVVLDDYGFSICSGITRLCEELERDARFFFLHNWNGHCVLLRRPQAASTSAR